MSTKRVSKSKKPTRKKSTKKQTIRNSKKDSMNKLSLSHQYASARKLFTLICKYASKAVMTIGGSEYDGLHNLKQAVNRMELALLAEKSEHYQAMFRNLMYASEHVDKANKLILEKSIPTEQSVSFLLVTKEFIDTYYYKMKDKHPNVIY